MRGELAVGCRVQVFWEGEDEWFEGVVDAYSTERGYYVKYDDGEEQWELDAGEHSIRFLADPASGRSDGGSASAVSAREVDNNTASSRTDQEEEDYDDAEEQYDDDLDDEEQVWQAEKTEDEEAASPTPEKEDSTPIVSKPVKSARAFMRNSTAFFRDADTLNEMRRELRQEKKTLVNQLHTLKMQLTEKEHVSAALKSELQQLKTSAALANVMRQVSRSSSLSSSPSGALNSLSKPKTAAQWGERVLGQKLENQCLAEDLLALKTAVQDKQLAVQRKQRRRGDMSVKLSRVPRRHLCSLLDLQVEIARLLGEKRALETPSHTPSPRLDIEKGAESRSGASNKAALQDELTSLEVTTEKYKEELRQWEIKIDCEKARFSPLETRLASLQQELQRYEDSQVLLRSVFLRLGPDSRDGCVSVDAALTAFQTLAPLDRRVPTSDEMLIRLKESSTLSSDGTIEQQRFSFKQFVDAFGCLFKS